MKKHPSAEACFRIYPALCHTMPKHWLRCQNQHRLNLCWSSVSPHPTNSALSLQAPEGALTASSCPYRVRRCLLSLQGTNDVPEVPSSLQDIELRSAANAGNANLTILQSLPITALDITILRLSRANCLYCQVASVAVMKNNAKKTPQAFLIFCKKKQLPTAAEGAHIIRANAHKKSEINGGVRSPPDLASKREREGSPTVACEAAGSKVIKEPDTEPSLTITLSNKQPEKLWL